MLLVGGCRTPPGLDLHPIPVGVTVDQHLAYYDVTAATLADLRQGIRQAGPRDQGRRWGAVTTWWLTWSAQSTRIGGNMCELRRPRVRVQTAITFPRWNPIAPPDSSLLAWWQQYNTGLAEHERGHALLAVAGAGEIVKALDGLHGVCESLMLSANARFQNALVTLNRKEEEYDRTTIHGATQIMAARRLTEPN